jgi:hypothetical protein
MNKPKTAAKLPQGRVMPKPVIRYLDPETGLAYHCQGWVNGDPMIPNGRIPTLVLPMPTLAAAKKRLRFERMTEEQKVEAMAWTLYRANNPSSHVPLPSFSKWLKMWQGPRDAETKERAWLRPARQLLSLIQP